MAIVIYSKLICKFKTMRWLRRTVFICTEVCQNWSLNPQGIVLCFSFYKCYDFNAVKSVILFLMVCDFCIFKYILCHPETIKIVCVTFQKNFFSFSLNCDFMAGGEQVLDYKMEVYRARGWNPVRPYE